MDTIKFNKKNSVVIAHRGLSGLERENTNVAFVAAGQRSYFGVETDVYRTLDGKYVLHHDTSTKRTAIDDLTIFESTFDTLRSLQLTDIDGVTKRADLRIPTLEEYVRTCKRYDKVCVLEFKTGYPVEHIAEMVEIIKKEEYLEKVIFISFAYENLTRLHEVVPGHPCQFLAWQWTDDLFDNLQRDGIDLDAYYGLLTEERVAEAHRRGLVVNAWTVDDPKVAEQLAEWGVDQITSNILE